MLWLPAAPGPPRAPCGRACTAEEGCSDSQRLSFLAEALTLGQFDHSHVVRLEGVVTRGKAGAPPVCGGEREESVVWEVGSGKCHAPGPLLSLGRRPAGPRPGRGAQLSITDSGGL